MWKFHVYVSTEITYDIIWGKDILMTSVTELRISDHIIKNGAGPYKG